MFTLFNETGAADVFCDAGEAECLHKAVADLIADISKVGGGRPTHKRTLPRSEAGVVVVGTLRHPEFTGFLDARGVDAGSLKGAWERYRIQTFGENGENLLLCGSDERGAMWAVYEFAERYLGVDPVAFWTDHEPERRSRLCLEPTFREDAPTTFPLRGWFLNDEDLLTEWKESSGRRTIDYPYYGQVVHPGVMEHVVECALRLRQNLLIPASFLDIDNPPEAALVEVAARRGLFVSQHHIEPLGVSHFALEKYWKDRGRSDIPSYVREPEAYREVWTHYAKKWARFPNVIWQLGLRGRGDRPVWFNDPSVPDSAAERGRLISEAMEMQWRIVAEVTGRKDFVTTTTLWGEGTELHNAGHLRFPEGTTIVFADTKRGFHRAYAHRWGDDFYSVKRLPEHSYGIYYHVAVWGSGPHLAQGVPLPKIESVLGEAVAKGDTAYAITNVANVREVIQGVAAVSAATWDFNRFNADAFLRDWCRRQFGEAAAAATVELYRRLWQAYPVIEESETEHPALCHDGTVVILGKWHLSMLQDLLSAGPSSEQGGAGELPDWMQRVFGKFSELEDAGCEEPKERVVKIARRLVETAGRGKEAFAALAEEVEAMEPTIPAHRRAFFNHHFGTQTRLMRDLNAWLEKVLCAWQGLVESGDRGRAADFLEAGAGALDAILEERGVLDSGKWRHWYRGDRKMELGALCARTLALKEFLEKEASTASKKGRG